MRSKTLDDGKRKMTCCSRYGYRQPVETYSSDLLPASTLSDWGSLQRLNDVNHLTILTYTQDT